MNGLSSFSAPAYSNMHPSTVAANVKPQQQRPQQPSFNIGQTNVSYSTQPQAFVSTNNGAYSFQPSARQQVQTFRQPANTANYMSSYNDPLIMKEDRVEFYQQPLPDQLEWNQTSTYDQNQSQLPQYYKYPVNPVSDVPPMASPNWQVFENGLKVQDLTKGFGPPVNPGDELTVEYVGKLKSTGEIFDQSHPSRPFTFTVGAGEVIDGWDQGLMGNSLIPAMLPGGKRILEIPSELAYGEAGAGDDIPPNSDLVFEVTLKKVN